MPFTTGEEIRIVSIEAALATAVAKIGAVETIIETKLDFDTKRLYAEKYDELKPAE